MLQTEGPALYHCGRNLLLWRSRDEAADVLAGRVQRIERAEALHSRAKDQRRIDGGKAEVGLRRLHEVPSRFLGECLACCESIVSHIRYSPKHTSIGSRLTLVPSSRVLDGLVLRQRIPILFGIGMLRPQALEWVGDGAKGRCNDLLAFSSGARQRTRMVQYIPTLFTVGAFLAMALRIPVVPTMAGSRRSFWTSVTL